MLHSDVMRDQLREWADLLEKGDFVDDIIAGMREVADDIDPASHPKVWPRAEKADGGRELGTILAALRAWQDQVDGGFEIESKYEDIATDGGTHEMLDGEEIDALCEKLNLGADYGEDCHSCKNARLVGEGRAFCAACTEEFPSRGKEAEELRSGVEHVLSNVPNVYDTAESLFDAIQTVLDGVDAGDSFAWLGRPLWERDDVQFPRLLAEIDLEAHLTDPQYEWLQTSMDLSRGEINDLFERAGSAWDAQKARQMTADIKKGK